MLDSVRMHFKLKIVDLRALSYRLNVFFLHHEGVYYIESYFHGF